ncbi:MAG: branched-chain amino acid ABC transporter permease, partial [Chloroflexi bacterium]|nr:branched-chain amino acid ABC transporter permease [Chloroflexota bacterium]
LINFAHGDVFMLGTFGALTLVLSLGLTRETPLPVLAALLLLALLGTMIFGALVNVLIERLAYRPLRSAPRLAPLISAIGVSFILMNIGLWWFGPRQVRFPDLLPQIDLLRDVVGIQSAVTFTLKDLFVIGVTVPLLLGLRLFVLHTRLGRAMRATAQDPTAAALMGINVNATIALAFLLGGSLAGAAGFIYGLYNNSAWFLQGFRSGLMAFTAAVFGGIGNLTGAALGGFTIGIISAFSDYLLDPRWTQVVVFGLLIVLLVFRQRGLLGEELPERA